MEIRIFGPQIDGLGLSRKSGSFKSSLSYHPSIHSQLPKPQQCPSLLDLCIHKITQEIHKYDTFSVLPRDLTHQIFNHLVRSRRLTAASLQAFRDCSLQDLYLGQYDAPVVNDGWMDVISSQDSSLLHLDLSASDVTDYGLTYLRDCKNIISINLNHCHHISDHGLDCISGLSNLTSLSFRRNDAISAQGLGTFSGLVNLVKLDLERCPGIHGGLVHLQCWFFYVMLRENLTNRCSLCTSTTPVIIQHLKDDFDWTLCSLTWRRYLSLDKNSTTLQS